MKTEPSHSVLLERIAELRGTVSDIRKWINGHPLGPEKTGVDSAEASTFRTIADTAPL